MYRTIKIEYMPKGKYFYVEVKTWSGKTRFPKSVNRKFSNTDKMFKFILTQVTKKGKNNGDRTV